MHDGAYAAPRILVVEDEAIIALDIADTLSRAGFHALGPATSLAEACDIADRETVDAALLDVMLGQATVWPFADRLADRGIAFLLMTGLDARADWPARHREAIMLAKPVQSARLIDGLRSILPAGRK